MASSGSLNTTAYSGRYLAFSWSQVSQDIENNTTKISWTLKGAGGDSTWYNTRNIKVTIEGETVYSFPQSKGGIPLSNGTLVASGEYIITHNADGYKRFTAYVEAGIYYHAVNCTGSGTFTLNTIPRASQPSCGPNWPTHDPNVGNFGDPISIHMNRNSSAFTHTVRYAFGPLSGTIATGVTTGTTWTIPLSFMDLLPANRSGSGRIYVDTYRGSTKIGTKWCGFTAQVPESVKPSISYTLKDVTEVDKIYGSPVQGLSKIQVTISATPAYSSPIENYAISIDGGRYTSQTITTEALRNSGSVLVVVAASDKRSRQSTREYTMNVQPYSPPKVTALRAFRCDEDGTENDQGDYIKVIMAAEITPLGNKNTASYSCWYKKQSEAEFKPGLAQGYVDNPDYSPDSLSFIFKADGDSTYDIEAQAVDRHHTATRMTTVSTAFTLMNWHPSGTGMAFGKIAETENTLQVGLDLQTLGNQYSFASEGTAGAMGFVRLAEITVKSFEANYPLVFELVRRGANTPMRVSILFTNTLTSKPALQTIWYEGSNYNAYVSETSDSVWGFYVQKYSSTDTVTISRWYTSEAMKDKVSVVFTGDLVSSVPLGLNGYYHATAAVPASGKAYTKTYATITADFKAYNDKSANRPWYRSSPMGLVEIGGIISPTAADNAVGSHTIVPIFTLPAGCRPAAEFYQLHQGSQQSIWQLSVATNGVVGASRYRNGSTLATPGTSAWMPFHAVFIADQ
jgi:hypothetical protein